MSCPVNFSTVKKGIENKAAEMLTQSGQFERVDQTSVRVKATTSDYNNLISNVNNAFREEIIKKHGEFEYKIQPSDNLINTYLEAAPVRETTAPIKPGVSELFESNEEFANQIYEALGFKSFDTKGITIKFNDGDWNIIRLNNKRIGQFKFIDNGEKNVLSLSIQIDEDFQNKGYGQIVHIMAADLAKKEYNKNLYSDYQNSKQEIQLLESLVKKGYAEKIGNIGIESKDFPGTFNTTERAFRIKTSTENLFQITSEQKQQYSQYLEQNPNGSVEQFKSWVDEFNSLQEDDFTNLNVFNFAEINLEEAKKIITNSFINATQEEAKLIYRKFAIQYHPDKGGSEELMKHLNDVNDKFKNGKLNKEKENINKQAVRKFYEEIKNNLEKHREGKTILGKTYNSNTFEYKNDIKLTSQDFIGGILSNKGYFKVGNFIRYALQNPHLFEADSLEILRNLTKGQYYNSENNLANTSIRVGNPSDFSSVNSLGAVFVKKSATRGYADISEIHINPAYFDIAFFENNLNNDKFKEFVNTIGHELVHKLTIPDLLSDNTTRKEIEEIYKAAKEAYETYTGVKNNITDYALSNLAEFTANYFNSKEFKDFLKTVTVKSENNKKQSLLDKLISVIIKFFNKNYGITEKNAYDYLTKVINNNTFYGVPNKVFVRKADYKSSNYSIDNLSDFISQKSQERRNQIQEIFNQNPKLSKIGTVEQYASYLDTIFPDSKVEEIDNSLYISVLEDLKFNKIIEKQCS